MAEQFPCYICDTPGAAEVEHRAFGDFDLIRCPRCGDFFISFDARDVLNQPELTPRQKANASLWIRDRSRPGNPPRIGEREVAMFRSLPTPHIEEKGERLMRYLEKRFPNPGMPISLAFETELELRGVAGAVDQMEVEFLFYRYLGASKRYLTVPEKGGAVYRGWIDAAGWVYLESLRQANPTSDIGFIAMWFSSETTELREKGLKPAILNAGYRPLPIDEHQHNHPIDSEIVAIIRRSKILVADLHHGDSGARGGVYFEAGLAMGWNIPVFWSCKQSDLDDHKIHFDVRQNVFTPWDDGGWERYVRRLSSLIEYVAGTGPYREPPI